MTTTLRALQVRPRLSTIAAYLGGILAASYWSGHMQAFIEWWSWEVFTLKLERMAEILWRAW